MKDRATKKRLQAQHASLQAHRLDVLEELAKKEVEDAKQHVAFSQRWLELSQAHLAELQVRKTTQG